MRNYPIVRRVYTEDLFWHEPTHKITVRESIGSNQSTTFSVFAPHIQATKLREICRFFYQRESTKKQYFDNLLFVPNKKKTHRILIQPNLDKYPQLADGWETASFSVELPGYTHEYIAIIFEKYLCDNKSHVEERI